jgi:hypothetical protein
MYICRLGPISDVVVILDQGVLECVFCSLDWDDRCFCTDGISVMGDHLNRHRAQGDIVPDWAFENLRIAGTPH